MLGLLCIGAAGCGSEGQAAGETVAEATATAGALLTEMAEAKPVPATPASTAPAEARPVTIKMEKAPDAAQSRIFRAPLAGLFADVRETVEGDPLGIAVAMADINGDDRDDMIVHVQDYRYCGQMGCSANVIFATPTGFANEALDLGVGFNATITMLPKIHNGLRDLEFDGSGVKFRWSGKEYEVTE